MYTCNNDVLHIGLKIAHSIWNLEGYVGLETRKYRWDICEKKDNTLFLEKKAHKKILWERGCVPFENMFTCSGKWVFSQETRLVGLEKKKPYIIGRQRLALPGQSMSIYSVNFEGIHILREFNMINQPF